MLSWALLKADPWGQPYVCVLVCLLGMCTQLPCHGLDLRTRYCGSLASLGTGVTLGKRDPPRGQSCCIWVSRTVHSCNPQPATEQFNAQGSCTGQAHTAGCYFSWIALLLLYLTASGSCLRRESESWRLPPLYAPFMKVHASSALRKLSKCGGINTKQSPLRGLLSAANCNYSHGYGTDGNSFLLQNTVPLENEFSYLKNSFWSFLNCCRGV